MHEQAAAGAGRARQQLHTGVVLAVGPHALTVQLQTDRPAVPACVGAGILVQPQSGDRVVLYVDGEQAWVVALLELASGHDEVQLSVVGAQSLQLQAPKLALKAKELAVDTERAVLRTGLLQFSAHVVKAVAQRLSVWADLIHAQSQTTIVRTDQRVTQVDGADILRARQVLTEGEELVRIEAPLVQVQGKENVFVNGKRISMG
ncbi:DUF3540 domain-containing protein [Variovorax saccharolyticus]|uniref:DUF3540 domain-containing protein n=1 Tax=Variovorax saccharolyticus TaxID=3053516 RepID=UPI0025777FEC|nr:DUF3540 domain-containing protein [Variovorax sp. J31P216]MDM0029787.1 DUF3540 domain-containing protein [Variovorax sp. J31P216]